MYAIAFSITILKEVIHLLLGFFHSNLEIYLVTFLIWSNLIPMLVFILLQT